MPQLEVRDSYNVQVFPEGMHVFHLPFSDDIRCPEKETSVVGLNVSLSVVGLSVTLSENCFIDNKFIRSTLH